MATITVNVDDEVYEKFRKLASEEHNGKKGFLGDAITGSMRKEVEANEQEAAKKRLLAIMKKGIRLGFKGYKCRDEIYEDRMEHILAGRH
ncbi:hypothetical protein HYU17_04805 [Candidatus Woesearchaeota archaeon]|nr:hypothetical protein [Candidatus Woesearchaeota archaeon]